MTGKERKKSLESLDSSFLEAVNGERGPGSAPRSQADRSEARKEEPVRISQGEKKVELLALLRVEVSVDAMEAGIRTLPARRVAGELTEAAILQLLQQEGVVFGIDRQAVKELVAAIGRPGGWHGEMVVARGVKPAGQKLELSCLKELGEKERQELQAALAFNLPGLFKAARLKEFFLAGINVKAVAAGELLATLPAGGQQSGRDVFGFPASPEWDHQLHLGEQVAVADDPPGYVATSYGYFQLRAGRLAVIPPVWLSPARMEAWYVPLPQIGPPCFPTAGELERILVGLGIQPAFFRQEAINGLCRDLAAGRLPRPVLVASGQPCRPGRNAEVELYFDPSQKAGALRENDTIDLRERQLVINVRAGDLLALRRPALKGQPGFNLFGEKTPAADGLDLVLQARQGVEVKESEKGFCYRAARDGVVMYGGNCLSVLQMYHLNGDVDYSTGNLEVVGDLHVSGNVRSGFSVKCGGNAIVEGLVETGASVLVDGDLTVRHGILGETTRVRVLGSLRTMFIQDAEVVVKGDIWVGSHIYNGSVRSTGMLTVQRGVGTRGGRVVGGVVCAADGIHLHGVGSPGNQSTLVALQADPTALRQIEELAVNVRSIGVQISKIIRTLGLESAEMEALRALVAAAPAAKRKTYLELLTHLSGSMKLQRRLQEKKATLQQEVAARLEHAAIRVSGEIHQGSRLRIGERTYEVERDMGAAAFRLRDDRIVWE